MKRNNKKGFTIVELVIVIAVIAILAGVLIPTFSGMVSKANTSKALQEATNAYKEAYAEAIADGKIAAEGETITVKGGWSFVFTGSIEAISCNDVTEPTNFGYNVTVTNGTVSVTKAN